MTKKRVLLIAITVFVFVNIGVFITRRNTDKVVLPKSIDREVTLQFQGSGNPIEARITRMVDQLRGESLRESLYSLPEAEYFRWPGSIDPGLVFYTLPLPKEVGLNSVQEILSNRRFRKILEELSGLSKQEQADQLLAALRELMAKYEDNYAEYCRTNENAFSSGTATPDTSPLIQMSDHPDGSPAVYGCRLSVLAWMLIAGNLQNEECHAAAKEICEKAVVQREEAISSKEHHVVYRYHLLRYASLYNRQILATALIGTSPKGGLGSEQIAKRKAEWVTSKLTKFDAPSTTYDRHYRHGAIKIPEAAKPLDATYLKHLDDDEFDRIYRENAR